MSTHIWVLTIAFFALVLSCDFVHAWSQRNKVPSLRTATVATLFYVSLAVIFGQLLPRWSTSESQQAFYAGWLTEYSLSLDNLFVFIMVFARLKIERSKQEMILLFGIGLSLVLRAIFLLSGAVLVEKWSFMFFFFGAFLIYTAIQVARDDGDEEWKENKLITFFKSKSLSVTSIAFISIALADIMFAFDSIPAIIGITTDTYVIITSNFFALMGLRQLYFLVEKLMVKLVYLSFGLAFILFFIGFKLIFEALISYDIHRVLSFDIPEITTKQSLLVIVLTLAVTTLFSLLKKQKPNYPL